MALADLIAPGSGRTTLHFPDEHVAVPYGELWRAGAAVGGLRAASGGQPTAVALTNTRACAAVLVGAIATGLPLISVPMPPRGAALDWYADFVRRVCAIAGASTLVVDASLVAVIPPIDGILVRSYDDVLAQPAAGAAGAEPDEFTFTQFTSGSTADPKGVVLPGAKIAANLAAILRWLDPRPGDGMCTWLPLSHDMGLIGTFLCALAGAGDDWTGGFDLVLLTPQSFLRSPARWLAACEEFGSTITAAPNYGYDMAARRRGPAHDLSRLRVCIAGGEPVQARSLTRFGEAFADCGFDPVAFAPAYGMAEAALAVTGTPVDRRWHVARLDEAALDFPHGTDGASGPEVVSSGSPLPGYEVRVDGTGLGEIILRGPSVADRYADGTALADAAGWFHTRDIGVLREGELYVLGRTDDVFHVAGRNIYALDVEAYANEVPGVRSGRVVAVPEDGQLTVVAECEPAFCDQVSVSRLARLLRDQVVSRVGVAPRRVLLTRRGGLPLTSSGKIRRRPLLAALQSAQLTVLDGSLS